jgi:hypothetical protein
MLDVITGGSGRWDERFGRLAHGDRSFLVSELAVWTQTSAPVRSSPA